MRKRRVQRRPKATKAAETLAPTPERKLHGEIEQVEKPIADSQGGYGHPHRAIDILAALRRRKAITEDMYAAGQRFQVCFTGAQLVTLQAADFGALRVAGERRVLLAERVEMARDRVWLDLVAVGGITSPAGSCLWHVLGWEETLKTWALEHGRLPAVATGILIAALGVLARA